MKKFLALLLVCVLAFALVACGSDVKKDEKADKATDAPKTTEAPETEAPETEAPETDVPETDEPVTVVVTSYEDFLGAEIDDEVVVETYVQGKQSWWDNKGTFYTQNEDGAYFLYEMGCTEEEYNALTVGTKIKVTGYKAEWAGELEIMDATFEILEGNYVAEPIDATALLGTDELVNYQNQLVSFKGMTVEAIEYKNGEPGDDIYVTLGLNGSSYDFCVEVYLTGTDSDVYTTVGALEVGNVVDVEGFLYWYEGVNPHITAIEVVG